MWFWFPCKIFLTNYLTKYFFCKFPAKSACYSLTVSVIDLKNKKEGNYHPSVLEICLQHKKLIGDRILKSELTIILRIKSLHYRTRSWHILRASTSIPEVSFFTCNYQGFNLEYTCLLTVHVWMLYTASDSKGAVFAVVKSLVFSFGGKVSFAFLMFLYYFFIIFVCHSLLVFSFL